MYRIVLIHNKSIMCISCFDHLQSASFAIHSALVEQAKHSEKKRNTIKNVHSGYENDVAKFKWKDEKLHKIH